MILRSIRDVALGVLTISSVAFAQDPATPPAPEQEKPAEPPKAEPATPPAPTPPAGAPRHRSATKVGDANVVVEHGQPPWNDDRVAQMSQNVPVGFPWRMGSETLSTLSVAGGPVFFGEELIRPGRYGINLLRTGETAWGFVVFEPLHEAQGLPQMAGDEPSFQIASKFASDAAESVGALTVDFTGGGDTATCELKFGPMRVTAPLSAVSVAQTELEIEGNPALASWYHRNARPDADPAAPTMLGTLDYSIDGENCAMNVYVMAEGANLVALFRNQSREKWERENAGTDEQVKRLEGLIQQFGPQAEAQVGPILSQLRRRRAKNEVMLEETVNLPDGVKFTAPAETRAPAEGAPARITCDVVKTRSGHTLEVRCGDKTALIRLDDAAFALKPTG